MWAGVSILKDMSVLRQPLIGVIQGYVLIPYLPTCQQYLVGTVSTRTKQIHVACLNQGQKLALICVSGKSH